MKICFLLERGSPPRSNPVMADVFRRLEQFGAEVALRYPEEELLRLDRLSVDADLYLLKSDTEMALSLATALEAMGGRVINSVGATQLAKDKVLAAAVLSQGGIPAPRSVIAQRAGQLAASVAETPLILKPHRGYHGVGMVVAQTPEELPDEEGVSEFVFAQEYLGEARTDLKVFVIGEQVFGVRKEFSPASFLGSGVPACLRAEVAEIARRCGKVFGLELYGLDIAESDGGAFVVDVNYFPGYRGVPDASQRLAEYIIDAARE